MADLCGGARDGFAAENGGGGGNAAAAPPPGALMLAAALKGEGKSAPAPAAVALKRRPSIKPSLEVDEFINLLHGSDPVRVELNRLENEVRGGNVVRSRFYLFIFFCVCFFAKKISLFFWVIIRFFFLFLGLKWLNLWGFCRQRTGIGGCVCGD